MALEERLNEIFVLTEGYSYMVENEDSIMMANCTCTLIKSPDCNIIVDTMTPWDSDLLLEKLLDHRIKPCDITWVVSTHGHSDHMGCNHLFLMAKHIVGTNISEWNRYFIHDFNSGPYRLSDTIEVVATPGHTLSSVSVLIRGSNLCPGLVAIVGDLFEQQNDITDSALWLDAGSEDPIAQRSNRAKIAATADFIIPGHGKMFSVDQQMRDELNKQAEDASLISKGTEEHKEVVKE